MPRYRIAVFKEPRAPWRDVIERAMTDAKRLGLASYDAAAREWYLALPVEMEVDMSVDVPSIGIPELR